MYAVQEKPKCMARVAKQTVQYSFAQTFDSSSCFFAYYQCGAETVSEPQTSYRGFSIEQHQGLDLAGQRNGKLGQEAGGIGGLVAIREVVGGVTNIYLPICDHNGNIHHLVDASTKQIVANYVYSPFGRLVGEWGSKVDSCPFRFQSKYYDEETGLYYFGYRYYDPRSTKWLSRDPLQERGGYNLTAAFANDPINKYDPLGLRWKLTTWLLSGGVSGDLSPQEIAALKHIDYSKSASLGKVVYSNKAGYQGLVGVVSVFENMFILGYDFGRSYAHGDDEDNVAVAMYDAVQAKGGGVGGLVDVTVEGFVHQGNAIIEGDTVAFGELAFSAYTVADSLAANWGNVRVPVPGIEIAPGPVAAPALAIVGEATIPVGVAAETAVATTMLMAQGDHGRKPRISKEESSVWRKLRHYRGRTKTNGLKGKARRYYEWDYTHSDIEVYNARGNHLGSMDPMTGKMYKGAVPGRFIKI